MTKQKGFLKDVTDNTVQSILHPKQYIRERREARGNLPTKPYVPTSGPDKWIADAQNYLRNKLQPEKQKSKLPLPVNTNTYGPKNLQEVEVTAEDKTFGPVLLPDLNVIGKKPQGSSKLQPKNTTKPKGVVNQKVVEWQNKLKAEGFDVGPIDGKWGKKTESAYQAYLKNKERLEKVGLPEDNAPFIEARQGFPTPESAYYKQGGKIEFKYLKKGGKVNGKTIPNNYDENVIPTKEEGGVDMNPNFKKIKPKQTTKPAPIYKPKPKVETKEKGGKMGKKCSCGCAMKISKNAKGGLIEACACGCKTKK